ncbi:MAG TPA: oligosaccharide flippase family protein [Bryobacteraceae bacterium]|nr:oligosaccharide flippase family protein [Bryobacteraceae bacterium]
MFCELARKTGIYAIAGVAGRALSIVFLPVYTRFLSPADYGVMELLDLTVNLVSLLLGARLGQAIFYFYFAAEGEREKEKCVSAALACSVICGILCVSLSLVFAPSLSTLIFGTAQYGHYLRLVFLGFGLSLPGEVAYCCLRAYGDSKRFVAVKLASQVGVAVLAVLLLVFFHAGINAMLVASVIGFAASAVYLSRHLLRPMRIAIDGQLMARLFRYSMPLGLSGLAVFLVHYGDRFFLRPRISLAELGVYSLAYKIGMLVSFCHAPFVLHWNAQICEIGQRKDGRRIFVQSYTYLAAGLSVVVVGLSVFAAPCLRLLTPPAFHAAARMVPWIAAAYLLRALGAHVQSLFTLAGKPGLEARVNSVGSAACVAGYALLVPPFGVWGAIAATLVGFAVILIYGSFVAYRVVSYQLEYGALVIIAISTAAALGLFFSAAPAGLWSQVALAAALTLAHVLCLVVACFPHFTQLKRSGRIAAPANIGLNSSAAGIR